MDPQVAARCPDRGGTRSAGRSTALRHGAERDADAVAADVGEWGEPRFSMDLGKKWGLLLDFFFLDSAVLMEFEFLMDLEQDFFG